MSPRDHDDLIERLTSDLAERQSGVSAPTGLGDDARRVARRRTATRAVTAGVPVLALAGVATVLATGATGGTADGDLAHAHDSAYVLRRVQARFAQDRASDFTTYEHGYADGTVNPDGSVSDLGPIDTAGWAYTSADGTDYDHSWQTHPDGSSVGRSEYWFVYPVTRGAQRFHRTLIDDNDHTFSRDDQVVGIPIGAPSDANQPAVGLGASSPEVQQALHSGELTEKGTTTIDGETVIALSTPMTSSTPQASSYHLTLYVDAHSYQPVRMIQRTSGSPVLFMEDYEPATAANIARAKDDSIPAGYTRVDGGPMIPTGDGASSRRSHRRSARR